MKITEHGYKMRTQKYYPMSMGELKLSIIQQMTIKNLQNYEIRIVNSSVGEVDIYHDLNIFILHDFCNGYELNVISAEMVHFNATNEDILIIHIEEVDENEKI